MVIRARAGGGSRRLLDQILSTPVVPRVETGVERRRRAAPTEAGREVRSRRFCASTAGPKPAFSNARPGQRAKKGSLCNNAQSMPTTLRQVRNLGYRVPGVRRRLDREDLLALAIAAFGTGAIVLGWVIKVHWRILF